MVPLLFLGIVHVILTAILLFLVGLELVHFRNPPEEVWGMLIMAMIPYYFLIPEFAGGWRSSRR